MKELIDGIKKENQNILAKNPKLAMEFDWSGDAYRLQYNEEMIGKLKILLIPRVSQQRELLNAFQEYYQKGDYDDEYSFDENINRFLKAFNCG